MSAKSLATCLFSLLGFITLGCTADLKRVHTPDLLAVGDREVSPASSVEIASGTSQVTAPSEWRIYSSLRDWAHLTDDSLETVAYSDRPESKDQYILIDLGQVCELSQVTQVHPESGGFPRRYRIDAAGEHNFPYSLVYLGNGSPGRSQALLSSKVKARFLRITLLEFGEEPWQVTELEIR
jgi:hypothetical protein